MTTSRAGAGIDAGGTTFKCGVTDQTGRLVASRRVPVTDPPTTLLQCLRFFEEVRGAHPFECFGIASFGPLDNDPTSPNYGTILETPKPGWTGTNLRQFFRDGLNLDVVVDTDVNGALLAEMNRGAAQNCQTAAYITIGTGIGAGIWVNGHLAGRPSHPEFGHIPVQRHPDDMAFPGTCPFHGDCLEGVASATAIRARFGDPSELAVDSPAWRIIADYLAQACRTLTLTLRPERIVLGGGLMLAPHLLALIREQYFQQLGGYLGTTANTAEQLIVCPGLGDDAGLLGAIDLGLRA